MGLFGRNKEPKKITRSFYVICEVTKDTGLTRNNLMRFEFPVFEDRKEASVFCEQLTKLQGVKMISFEMGFDEENINQIKQKGVIFIGKKDDDIDYRCWSCKALFSHKQVKWKHRTFKTSVLGDGDAKVQGLLDEAQKITGMKDEQTASPNRIFNGNEYEYRGYCPKCNVELTCFWLGIDSVKKNPKSIAHNENFECPTCDNVIRKEFQIWYSIRIQVENEIKEYLVTVCPKCKDEIVYGGKCDFGMGIIE